MKDSKLKDDPNKKVFYELSDEEKIMYRITLNANFNLNKIYEVIANNNNPFLCMNTLEDEISSIINVPENKLILNSLSDIRIMHIKILLYQYIAVTMTKTIFMRNQDINEQILLNNICSCNVLEN